VPSSDTQFVDALDGLAAGSAKERAAVAAQQGIGSRLGAVRAVELGSGGLGIGHIVIIPLREAPAIAREMEVLRDGTSNRPAEAKWHRE